MSAAVFFDYFVQALFGGFLFVFVLWIAIGRRKSATRKENLRTVVAGALVCAALVAIFRTTLIYVLNGATANNPKDWMQVLVYILAPLLFAIVVVRFLRPAIIFRDGDVDPLGGSSSKNSSAGSGTPAEAVIPRPALEGQHVGR